ncbi:S-methyl-5-thioribose-1-phosphate isomerase [Salinisphaera sp. Q1T1-3]|uniref:S-methyl-5-thioribose-1-phosphate isomerase n=1 Tax=Salinisphaera sp. Q1T1-3 TaxID=2321229 RepID=UPI000E71E8AA|nr:S-methyl-5-thioribose-1-phosphate isomerase [Salinisphaera sp. Q1T1-3]RJS92541.1 S-methyl-5-thioribose-1-phosphate isomerase [Salinisphaera sp. Q1T1-3]
MQPRDGLGLKVHDGRVCLLDQTRLPQEEVWLTIGSTPEMVEAIRALRVRGAPMIGVAAALHVAARAEAGDEADTLADDIAALRAARPTAVNLMFAMDRLAAALSRNGISGVIATAESIADRDVMLCEAIADNGAALIGAGERILTHCNTGALATAGIGTAAGVIRRAHEQDKGISVWVDETRPLLQGGRLTAWEFGQIGVPYTLITDSMAAALMREERIDRVIVGADRIAANGDVANKIGTYGLAVLARYHEIPFAVAAPYTTLDPECETGAAIEVEQRDAAEVRGVTGPAGDLRWAPADAPVHNPAFDITPATLIDHWILDIGVFGPSDVAAGALDAGGAAFG